jgi:hypothetical protein
MNEAETAAERRPGFEIVPIVIDEYQRGWQPLDTAHDYVAGIASMLAPYGGVLNEWTTPGSERTKTAAGQRLAQWASPATPRSSLLLWVGHGHATPLDAWLATYEAANAVTGVKPADICDAILAEWASRLGPDRDEWVIVVVEACGAATFVKRLNALIANHPHVPSRLALIGVGADDGATGLGTFGDALAQALDAFNDNDDEVRILDLVHQLDSRLASKWIVAPNLEFAAPLRPRRLFAGSTVTAPMDFYAEMLEFVETLSDAERYHFLAKARGADVGEQSWFFVGRAHERRRLFRWLRTARHGMMIVTGRAGSGKSALLGNLMVETNRPLRALLERQGHLTPADEADLPPADAFNAMIHLSGLSTDGVLSRIAEAAGVDVSPDSSAAVDQLADAVRGFRGTFRILADALDEAQEPIAIAASLLRRLATLPNTVVVVGTRASTSDGPDHVAYDEDLLEALGHKPDAPNPKLSLIRVLRDETAIQEYVSLRLTAAVGEGRLEADGPAIASVARMITSPDRPGAQNRQFLYARLAIHEILADPELIRPANQPRLERILQGGHADLFEAAVSRLGARSPGFLPLLSALALARGRGVSRTDGTWLAVAQALSRAISDEPSEFDEMDIDELLDAASPYVMLDAQHGQSVYRLAHRTFQEHFESLWS